MNATAPKGLDRDAICAAAVALADGEGLSAVTMRAVGATLGVRAMSLYHHVRDRADLLDGMVDAVFTEVHTPAADPDWQQQMRTRCASLRAALVRHRWAVGLLDGSTSPGPAALAHHDAMIGCLRAAGFAHAAVATALTVLDAHVLGFVLQEVALPIEGGADPAAAELASDLFPPGAREAYPHLVAFTTEYTARPGHRFADEFDVGLGIVLDGLVRYATPDTRETS